MRYFRSSSFHVSSLPTGLRIVLTLYLIANLFGLAVSSTKFLQRMDPTPASVTRYYQGEKTEDSGEVVILPGGETEGKSVRYLTDVTHPHLFTVPLVLLVVAHLAHLTRVRQLFLGLLDFGAFLGFFLMFGTPWVLSLAPATMAVAMILGAGLLTVCMTGLCVIPLVGMWRRPKGPSARPSAPLSARSRGAEPAPSATDANT